MDYNSRNKNQIAIINLYNTDKNFPYREGEHKSNEFIIRPTQLSYTVLSNKK